MSDYLVEKSQADIIKEGEERFRLALDSVGDGAVGLEHPYGTGLALCANVA